jgi:hypothetical protein
VEDDDDSGDDDEDDSMDGRATFDWSRARATAAAARMCCGVEKVWRHTGEFQMRSTTGFEKSYFLSPYLLRLFGGENKKWLKLTI